MDSSNSEAESADLGTTAKSSGLISGIHFSKLNSVSTSPSSTGKPCEESAIDAGLMPTN